MGARGDGSGAGEMDRPSDWGWEVWGQGDAEVRLEYKETGWSRNSGESRGPLRGEQKVERWWGDGAGGRLVACFGEGVGSGIGGGGEWELSDVLTRELSAVLNLECRLTSAIGVAGFEGARCTSDRVLLLTLNLGELYTKLNPEA